MEYADFIAPFFLIVKLSRRGKAVSDKMIFDGRLRRLYRLWLTAIFVGAVGFFIGLLWANSSQGPGLDWIWGIAVFGAAVILYNITFFLACSIFAPGLGEFVQDDTEVHGDDVVHIVRHAETGNEAIDAYIRAYANARATSAVTIVSAIMIAIALIFF